MSAAVIANPLISGKPTTRVGSSQTHKAKPGADTQDRLVSQGAGPLLSAELAVIHERTKPLLPAIKTVNRIQESVQDHRVKVGAIKDERGGGVWSSLISTLRGAGTIGLEPLDAQKRILEQKISLELSDLKRIIERVLVPSLVGVRELFRGRTFERNAETPKALLLVSIPTEKVGKILSFDALRAATQSRARSNSVAKTVDGGDGRILLVRTIAGKEECLEFAYRRPGKVDIYLGGERQGSMWTDEAFKVVRAFSRGQELTFKKQKRFTEYTVY
jgi:hypothetical protein